MRKLIIDRFEGDFAVCETEDLEFVNFPKAVLPLDAKEGDVIQFQLINLKRIKEKKKSKG